MIGRCVIMGFEVSDGAAVSGCDMSAIGLEGEESDGESDEDNLAVAGFLAFAIFTTLMQPPVGGIHNTGKLMVVDASYAN